MPGHSCCSHMLINICFSILTIPWWLEDSTAAEWLLTLLPCTSWGSHEKKANWWFGEGGTKPSAGQKKALRSLESFCCFCHKEFCKDHWVWICALYVSFYADLRRDGLSYLWCTADPQIRGQDFEISRLLDNVIKVCQTTAKQ